MDHSTVLNELRAGNDRFVTRASKPKTKSPVELASGQSPSCAVLSCADSRVPVEQIFDQDLGDLFVIRVAGNVASEEAVASIEYAVANLGTRVVMVLGHTGCGAVGAACDHQDDVDSLPSENLKRLVKRLVPSVKATPGGDHTEHINHAVEHHTGCAVEEIQRSPVIANVQMKDALRFVRAVYDLETGKVKFLDG